MQPTHPFEVWQLINSPDFRSINLERVIMESDPAELEGAVYTSIRSYNRESGNPSYLYINKHFDRLRESLVIEHGEFRFSDELLKTSLASAVEKSALPGEIRIKIVIAPRRSNPILFMIEPLTTPRPEDYKRGVQVYTTNYIRKDPKAKVFEFVEIQDQIRGQFGQRVEEVIMLDPSGGMLEGLSSNFFAILDGILHTAARGVLNGITRQIVIEIAKREGYKLLFKKPNIKQIDQFSECFITSTSRGVLPVNSIDHKIIGSGKPGPITLSLHKHFDERIPQLVKPL